MAPSGIPVPESQEAALSGIALAAVLLSRGVIDVESIVGGDLVVRRLSRRHENHLVLRRHAASCFVKHGLGNDRREAVAHEARTLATLGPSALRPFLPGVIDHDERLGLLVLEMAGKESLAARHRRTGLAPEELGEETGCALARLHNLRARTVDQGQPPWALEIHRPTMSELSALSATGLAAVGIAQRSELGGLLDTARAEWRSSAILHGDVRWDNLVIRDDPSDGARLALVDWELAGPGDPCWDLGCAFAQPLGAWLHSIPITGADPPERFHQLARHPIESMWPWLRALWRGYSNEADLGGMAREEHLVRATRFAGAWLVQSAVEHTEERGELTSVIILHLQLAMNVMRRPREAAGRLLGLGADAPGRQL